MQTSMSSPTPAATPEPAAHDAVWGVPPAALMQSLGQSLGGALLDAADVLNLQVSARGTGGVTAVVDALREAGRREFPRMEAYAVRNVFGAAAPGVERAVAAVELAEEGRVDGEIVELRRRLRDAEVATRELERLQLRAGEQVAALEAVCDRVGARSDAGLVHVDLAALVDVIERAEMDVAANQDVLARHAEEGSADGDALLAAVAAEVPSSARSVPVPPQNSVALFVEDEKVSNENMCVSVAPVQARDGKTVAEVSVEEERKLHSIRALCAKISN